MLCPLWVYDDVTVCFRHQVLEYWYPIVVGGASIVILFWRIVASLTKKKGSIRLDDETRPLLASNNTQNETGAVEDSVKSRHFDLVRLSDTGPDDKPRGHFQVIKKSTFERLRVCLEFVLVAFELAYAIAVFFLPSLSKEWSQPAIPIVHLALWGYLFVLVLIRTINLNQVNIKLPGLWRHSTFLYAFNFLPAVITFRSALLGHVKSAESKWFYVGHFIASTLLLFLNLTSTTGDKPARLFYPADGSAPSPESVTSVLGFITYSWLDKMVWGAYKNGGVEKSDIWGLSDDDYALPVLKSFEAMKSTASFSWRLFAHFKYLFAFQGFFAICESILIFGPSLLLKKLLEYVQDPSTYPVSVAWGFVLLMPIVKIFDSFCSGCSLFMGRRVCVRMRAIIIGEVYAKALRRRITVADDTEEEKNQKADKKEKKKDKEGEEPSEKTAELGAIINLMAIDAFKVSEICGYLHFFVSALLLIFICVFFLYTLLGYSALIGSLSIICLLPVNYKIALYLGELQKRMLAVTDKRIQKMNETFQSIRIVKFFAWENKFFDSIMDIRNDELKKLKHRSVVWVAGGFVWFMTPTLVTLFSFYIFTIIQGNTLTAPIAFTSLSLFTLLRSPLDQLSDMTSFVMQSKASLDRVDDFLNEPETNKYEQLKAPKLPDDPVAGFKDASFSWNPNSENDFKLRDISIDFQIGKLNVIIGPTGSGKTSLLLALLGEMHLTKGEVFLPGFIPRHELVIDPNTGLTDSVAYCSQSPWLLNDTIRNNILFSAPFNQERYTKVIEACGLKRDLEILAAGDSTEIGEKGIALSGGQKQRVSLARALYSNSKHVILDDCLSAVDSHTALWIYENCISGPLMNNRTCILVSHNVALTVQKADWIVVMNNGRIEKQGTPLDLLDSGHLGEDELVKSSIMNSRNQSSTDLKGLEDKNADMKAKANAIEAKLKAIAGEETEGVTPHDGKLTEEETKAEGVVDFKVYKWFMGTLGGFFTWFRILLMFVISQGTFIFQSWWLRNWSLHSESSAENYLASTVNALSGRTIGDIIGVSNFLVVRGANNIFMLGISKAGGDPENTAVYYIAIYGLIGLIYGVTACLRIYVVFFAGIDAANMIFKQVLTNVLYAKLRFFDKTPIGRIMNRFSKDIESVDQELTPCAEGVFGCVVACVSTLMLIAVITPGFLFFAFLIGILYYMVGYFYMSLSRELKRFESITKSPIHQHFSESLTGVATIRAYGVETRYMKENLAAVDTNNRPFFYLWVANRWFAFRNDLVGSLVMLTSGIFVLLSVGKIDAGLAGLSMSYAISFSENALWIVRLYANVEMNMNSVERLREYLVIEQEEPADIPETKPRKSWPERGEISVRDVSLRYAPELPRVIKNVTFDVEPNNKVGIVGRTGAGKSTIITAFFRFLDPETGTITIDGVDISKIGLRDLRQAITIIPQDPTLFTGTIRSNLDLFEQYSDAEIYEALRRVNLISREELNDLDAAKALQEGENANKFLNLDSQVSEGGGNLSQGQRQLMCLARSLLKSPKVILLDEATASIDYKSDAMIQNTIREEFGNSTILTIAHRLRSIIDYDRILVMDAGKVVEYDDPYVLIADKSSLFYSMCENSGELDVLTQLAKESFVAKKNKSQK